MSNILGIYKITNIIDDRTYIGSSINCNKRINEHKNHLLKRNHHNIHLQRFVNKHGLNSIEFSIIELCSKEILLQQEEYWFNQFENKFNIAVSAEAPMLGKTHSLEYKLRRSEMMKGDKNINFGKKRPDHIKIAVSLANKNNKLTLEQRIKQIQNISNKKRITLINNNQNLEFDSISDASKYLNVTYQSVSKALHHKRKCNNHIVILSPPET